MLRKLPCHLLACWGSGLFANTAEGGTACYRPTPLQGDSARPVVPGQEQDHFGRWGKVLGHAFWYLVLTPKTVASTSDPGDLSAVLSVPCEMWAVTSTFGAAGCVLSAVSSSCPNH